jgi:uncharacterized membrane protein YedE/YeeE
MERRVFLCEVGAVALGSAWRMWPLVPALTGLVPHASVAVFDPTLVEGRMLAHRARCSGCVAWAVADSDIGGLWHAQLARRLAPGAALVGALRPSDRFVLSRLAATRRVTLREFSPAPAKTGSQDCAHRT